MKTKTIESKYFPGTASPGSPPGHPPPYNTLLGQRVQALRTSHGLRREYLAAALNVGINTVRNIELGHGCHAATAARAADFFGVSLDYLFGLSERKTRLAPPAPG